MRVAFYAFLIAFSASCSIPNLESPDCTQARNDLKRFYSMRLGGAGTPADADAFSTPGLAQKLSNLNDKSVDYFTTRPYTEDVPVSFRVGECSPGSDQSTAMQVKLFSKNGDVNLEREITVRMETAGDRWLIDEVSPVGPNK